MKKKTLIGIVVIFAMILSVLAFAGCEGFDLDAHKASAITAIESHAETKRIENNYTNAGLEAIDQAVIKGKAAVDEAATKTQVDKAVEGAIVAIDEILPEKGVEMTEEEHLSVIREKLQVRYFNNDGTPTSHAYFQCYDADGKWTGEYVTTESFNVEILLSYDGKLEYFLITYEPFAIGFVPGVIIDNEYRIFTLNQIYNSSNPFEENEIEKENRFYMFPGSARNGIASIKNGAFVDLIDGHIYSENEIKDRLQFLRSKNGLDFMRNYSVQL